MKIVFRTDSSLKIGSGHVMRCLTLADLLRQRGGEVTFVCREHPGHLISLIEGKGYRVARLPQPEAEFVPAPGDLFHAPWLAVSWERDAADTVAALSWIGIDWLVTDLYALDRRWERMLRPHVGRIMVIDDLADRPHDCDLLLDQNLHSGMEKRYYSLTEASCRKLLGPRFALLRPEFAQARGECAIRNGEVRRILLFFGGVDQTDETQKALHALAGISGRLLEVDVVAGGGNLHKEEIQAFCAAHDGFSYHCQIDNMAQLMARADLAIGAGGTATWERCAVGLPALVISVAANQVDIAYAAGKAGVLSYLGTSEGITVEKLSREIFTALSAREAAWRMSEKGWSLVDGRGSSRVAEVMEGK